MIDIIIPTIDDPKYIDRALKSVALNCSPHNTCVYIINDNSKYESRLYEEVINEYSQLNICYIVSPKGEGPGPARNRGIRAGHGDYIVFLDCDDIFVDDPAKYCDTNYDFFTSSTNNPLNIFCSTDANNFFSPVHGMGIKREFLEQHNLYFPEIPYGGEDTIFRCCCMSISNNWKKYTDKTFYEYQLRPGSSYVHRHVVYSDVFPQDKPMVDRRHQTSWLACLANYLDTLKYPNGVLESDHWQFSMLSVLFQFCGDMYYHTTVDSLIFVIYIIKKYINYRYLTKKSFDKIQPKVHIYILYFIDNFFFMQDNWIIFKPTASTVDYEKFFMEQSHAFPSVITENFNSMRPFFFNISYMSELWSTYYYTDNFS